MDALNDLILVVEYCDAFSVSIYGADGQLMKEVYIDQEDSVSGLVEFFEFLGFKTEYSEAY